MAKVFLDTNVVVYANDTHSPAKQTRALEVMNNAGRSGDAAVSTQVLAEYAYVADKTIEQSPAAVLNQLLFLESLEVVQLTPALIRRGVELQNRYMINFWDATIIAAAEYANCSILLSEDLNPGQLYTTVRVENPFAE